MVQRDAVAKDLACPSVNFQAQIRTTASIPGHTLSQQLPEPTPNAVGPHILANISGPKTFQFLCTVMSLQQQGHALTPQHTKTSLQGLRAPDIMHAPASWPPRGPTPNLSCCSRLRQ